MFPRMRTPFAKATPYDQSSRHHPLVLHFKDESSRPELQELRALLTSTQERLNTLIGLADKEQQEALALSRRNTLIRAGKPKSDGDGNYPDFVTLKFTPATVTFATPEGEIKNLATLDLRKFELEPTVWLKDVWEVAGTYYPRMILESCILHELKPVKPAVPDLIDSDDDMDCDMESTVDEDGDEQMWGVDE